MEMFSKKERENKEILLESEEHGIIVFAEEGIVVYADENETYNYTDTPENREKILNEANEFITVLKKEYNMNDDE